MEIRFRAKRAAFNMTVTTPPLIVEDEFLLQDKKGHYQNCDGNTLEIVIDGQAIKVAKIKELMKLKDEIKSIITLYYNDYYKGNIIDEFAELINKLEDKPND